MVCAGRATSRMRKENGARPDFLTRRMRAPASPDEEIFPSLLFLITCRSILTVRASRATIGKSETSPDGLRDLKRGAIHTTVHYTLPDGDYKWPPSKYQLTFGFLPGTPSAATGSIVQAFAIWQKSTRHFKFSQSNNPQNADLKISFHKRDHGDGDPFDGPGGQLAHAAYPTGGTLHYDAEETWSAGAKPGAMDYGSVGLHEIGHLLGLGHSSVEGAVMFPTVTEGVAYKDSTIRHSWLSLVWSRHLLSTLALVFSSDSGGGFWNDVGGGLCVVSPGWLQARSERDSTPSLFLLISLRWWRGRLPTPTEWFLRCSGLAHDLTVSAMMVPPWRS
ncbi:hypothetical protein ACLB2K_061674 [Fragaria x ananassa]